MFFKKTFPQYSCLIEFRSTNTQSFLHNSLISNYHNALFKIYTHIKPFQQENIRVWLNVNFLRFRLEIGNILLKMSFSEIEQGVPLQDSDLFNHSSVLKPQIEKFHDNFERNQRHREFDGLIRRNHRVSFFSCSVQF